MIYRVHNIQMVRQQIEDITAIGQQIEDITATGQQIKDITAIGQQIEGDSPAFDCCTSVLLFGRVSCWFRWFRVSGEHHLVSPVVGSV